MAKANPYDCGNYPGKFEISYAGHDAGFYCFVIDLTGKGLDPLMFEMELSQWLFDHTQGKWFMGNDFPYPEHPKPALKGNPNDSFILFEQLVDVVMFERNFKVVGLTPSMLV